MYNFYKNKYCLSPSSYAKSSSDEKEGDEHLALPHLESEYERHARQTKFVFINYE